MQMQFNSRTSAFQADGVGALPIICPISAEGIDGGKAFGRNELLIPAVANPLIPMRPPTSFFGNFDISLNFWYNISSEWEKETDLSMNDRQCFASAKKAAQNSDFYKCHTGCVAVYGGKIIARGWNGCKTHSLQTEYNKYRDFDETRYPGSIHAEMMVVQKIKYLDIDFSKVKIYISRGGDMPRLSKPCPACENALRDLGIRKVFYTGNGQFLAEKY